MGWAALLSGSTAFCPTVNAVSSTGSIIVTQLRRKTLIFIPVKMA
ncbi:MAG: hypothetical protein AAFU71_02965 [Cyanobacteria bacterium J06632_22]